MQTSINFCFYFFALLLKKRYCQTGLRESNFYSQKLRSPEVTSFCSHFLLFAASCFSTVIHFRFPTQKAVTVEM